MLFGFLHYICAMNNSTIHFDNSDDYDILYSVLFCSFHINIYWKNNLGINSE